MCAGSQATAKQAFDFQAMDLYNTAQSHLLLCAGKTASAGLKSALADLLYHKNALVSNKLSRSPTAN